MTAPTHLTQPQVTENETLASALARNVRDALTEDLGLGDPTASLVPLQPSSAELIVRESAVLCGRDWFEGCFRALDPEAQFDWQFQEGEQMPADSLVCRVQTWSRPLLTAERPALNLLQTLSATASTTRAYVEAVAGLSPNPKGCQLLDTRKTLPGLRQAQKYAVRVGGGANQRLALFDGILIKENHIAAAGGVAQALALAAQINAQAEQPWPVQIEVETLGELVEALRAGATSVLLDNFRPEALRAAVALNQAESQALGRSPALLEASGGLDLESLKAVVATGVDRVSIGALTKHVLAIDYSLRVRSPA